LRELTARMNELPKRVFSITLRAIGSISLVRSMMQVGLVDRLRLIVFPVILGAAGREPIYAGFGRSGLESIETRVLDSRLILLESRPALVCGPAGVFFSAGVAA
jgi:dihydrofolate reductase